VSIGDRSIVPSRGPEQIRNRQFGWVRKGYDPEQVKDFLGQLAEHVDALESELRAAREELDRASRGQTSGRGEAYQELAKRMDDVLAMADAQAETVRKESEQAANQKLVEAEAVAERIRKEAKADAERARFEAKDESERIVREAKVQAEQLRRENEDALRKARTEAEHIVGVLSSRRDMLLQEVQTTRDRLMWVLDRVNAAVPPPTGTPGPLSGGQAQQLGQQVPPQPGALSEQAQPSRQARPQLLSQAGPSRESPAEEARKPSPLWAQLRTREEGSEPNDQEGGEDQEPPDLVLPARPALEEELEG